MDGTTEVYYSVFNENFRNLDRWNNKTFYEPLSLDGHCLPNEYNASQVYTDAAGAHIRAELSGDGTHYLSGWLDTRGKKTWQYGYFEARVRWPNVPGIWSGFFAVNDAGWPPEIDAGEVFGNAGTVQFQVRKQQGVDYKYSYDYGPSLFGQWHKFGFLWEADKVVYYIDDIEYWRTTEYVPNMPMVLYVMLAMGEAQTPDNAMLPASMDVEYVRVWQK